MNCLLELIKLIFLENYMLATNVTSGWSYFTLYDFDHVGGVFRYSRFLSDPEYVVCDLIKVTCFLKETADLVLVFDWIAGSRQVNLL